MSNNSRITRRQFVVKGTGLTAALAGGRPLARGDTTEADVLIIGAGAFGCHTAWHLQQRGKKVLVLDAQPSPATQASRAGAGFVALWSAVHVTSWGKTEWDMQRYGINFYTRLARDTQEDIGFAPCGISYIYLTSEAWKAVQGRAEIARGLGTKLEVLSAERAKKLLPPIAYRSTVGVLFDPEAIRVRAGDAIAHLAKQLARNGVHFKYNTPVTGFVRAADRVVGVKTAAGEYRAPQVVVAAGAWSRRLLKTAGAHCPVNVMADTRYTTKPLAQLTKELPLLVFSDRHGIYIRYEKGGLLIGGDNQPANADAPPWADRIPNDGAGRVRTRIREVEQAMPVLKDAEVDVVRSSVASYTGDHHFILDGVPAVKGLYVMTACQEAGVTHGPALGKMMAELLVDGRTHLQRDAFRLTRF